MNKAANGLDESNRKILNALLDNQEKRQKAIASEIGLSDGRFSDRKKKLQEEGIIKKFTIEIDYGMLGYTVTGYFHIQIIEKDPQHTQPVEDFLAGHPNIIEIYELFGKSHDYLVKIMCRSNEELRSIGSEISALENVNTGEAYTYPVARTLKCQQGVPLI